VTYHIGSKDNRLRLRCSMFEWSSTDTTSTMLGKKKTFEALNLLWSVAEQGGWSSTEIARATGSNGCHLPRIDFIAEMDNCAVCRATTVISRSKNRTVVTYAEGMFEAVEVQKKCSVDC